MVEMTSQEDVKKHIFEYVREGQKLKLCILDTLLKRDKASQYDVVEALSRYYPLKLFTISQAYESLKKEGLLIYDAKLYSDVPFSKEIISKVFSELSEFIEPILNKNFCGRGDIMGTMDEKYSYLIKRMFIRGGSVSEETLLSDIQRDIFSRQAPYDYSRYEEFKDLINVVRTDLSELRKRGYIKVAPYGYALPDFVFNNILSDSHLATELFGTLSRELWMAFEFETYLSNVRKIESKFPKLSNAALRAVEYFSRNQFNDALDYVNSACEELADVMYAKIKKETEKAPSSPHAKLVEIWKEQHLWKEDPILSDLGKNAAVFLSSAVFIPKWIRDKTSHPLVAPTADSIRLALASLLIAIDVAIKLKILD